MLKNWRKSALRFSGPRRLQNLRSECADRSCHPISASLQQQFLALELGLSYAAVFHKTGSLFGPILSHGYSNTVLYIIVFTGTLLAR